MNLSHHASMSLLKRFREKERVRLERARRRQDGGEGEDKEGDDVLEKSSSSNVIRLDPYASIVSSWVPDDFDDDYVVASNNNSNNDNNSSEQKKRAMVERIDGSRLETLGLGATTTKNYHLKNNRSVAQEGARVSRKKVKRRVSSSTSSSSDLEDSSEENNHRGKWGGGRSSLIKQRTGSKRKFTGSCRLS